MALRTPCSLFPQADVRRGPTAPWSISILQHLCPLTFRDPVYLRVPHANEHDFDDILFFMTGTLFTFATDSFHLPGVAELRPPARR